MKMKNEIQEKFMEQFQNIKLAGLMYEPQKSNAFKWGWEELGRFFFLKREPDNPYDPNAIGVFFLRDRIGYIQHKLAVKLSVLMDCGHNYDAILISRDTNNNNTEIELTVTIVEVP